MHILEQGVHCDVTRIKSTPTAGATVEDIWNSRVKRLLALPTPFYSMLSFWFATVQCSAELMVSRMEVKSGWQA